MLLKYTISGLWGVGHITDPVMAGKMKPISWSRQVPQNGSADAVGDCIICTSHHLDRDGYPEIMREGKRTKLPRLVMFRRFGKQISRIHTRHICDTPACINPDHIIPGTNIQNVRDKVERDRQCKGVRNGRSKLTNEMVATIKARLRNYSGCGALTCLAKEFGVSAGAISHIKQRRQWKHVASRAAG